METLKAPDATRGEMTRIRKSIVIKGEFSCCEDLYIDGQVEGTIGPCSLSSLLQPPLWRRQINRMAAVVVARQQSLLLHGGDALVDGRQRSQLQPFADLSNDGEYPCSGTNREVKSHTPPCLRVLATASLWRI